MNNVFEKIKNLIFKFINRKYKSLPEATITNTNENINTQNNFKKSLNMKKDLELLHIQQLYEDNKISEKDLSVLQVMDLIELYKSQLNNSY